jgi:hypothetical protein
MNLRFTFVIIVITLTTADALAQCEVPSAYDLYKKWTELTLKSISNQVNKADSSVKEQLMNRADVIKYEYFRQDKKLKRSSVISSRRLLGDIIKKAIQNDGIYVIEGILSGEQISAFNYILYPIRDSVFKVRRYTYSHLVWTEEKMNFNPGFIIDRVAWGVGRNNNDFSVSFFSNCSVKWTEFFLQGTVLETTLPTLQGLRSLD